MNKESNFLSAVIYVHNAENRIEPFLKMVIHTLEQNFEHSEIICVNDSSADLSADKIRETGKEAVSTTVSLLNMSYFHGLEAAMNAGVDLAIGDFVFEFDSTIPDFVPEEILRVYSRALQGYDIVSACPNKKQKASSRLFYFVFDHFTKLNYEMRTERFRILSRRVINRISSMNKTVPYRKAIYANCGLKTDRIRYETSDSGTVREIDKTEKKYRRTLAVDSLLLFTDLGYIFTKTMTLVMIFAALFVAVYSVIVYLIGSPVAGWTTTILFLSFCFFGLFGILSFVIKYLQLLVNLVFKRKKYSFESIEKITG